MAARCLACHVAVRGEIDGGLPLHGKVPQDMACRDCHTEHNGPHAALTSFESFDHDFAAFPLTGAHRRVSCRSCHRGDAYKGTPRACAACHDEPGLHRGRFGTACAACHTTHTWKGATFEHRFPLSHGRGKRGASACAVCHPDSNDLREYTCYGCHRHDPEKTERKHVEKGIADVSGCAKCHPGGRKDRKRKSQPSVEEPGSAAGFGARSPSQSRPDE